jgi:predicted P-loop ATPase
MPPNSPHDDDVHVAETFLSQLYGDDPQGWLTIFAMPGEHTHWVPAIKRHEAALYAVRMAAAHNVYFGVGLRGTKLKKGRGTSPDVIAIPGLYVDIDIKHKVHKAQNLPASIEDALTILKVIPCEPTCIVDSGHGLHAYWLFRELWTFESEVERQRAARLNQRLQATLKAEAERHGWHLDGTADLARVLRIPGTYNRSVPDAVMPVKTRHDDHARRWNPVDFEPYIVDLESVPPTNGQRPELPAADAQPIEVERLNVPAGLKYLIHLGQDATGKKVYPSRSEALYAAVQWLLKVGIDDQTIMALAMDARYAISEKPREQGASWLAAEIARAKAKRTDKGDNVPQPAEGNRQTGGVIMNDRKRMISCQHNALVWLTEHQKASTITMDTFKQTIAVDTEALTDETVIELVRQMEASTMIHWAKDHVWSAAVSLGARHATSSLRTWLDSLRWDRKQRLRTFFTDAYGSEMSDYTAACAKVLFLSAVARAYQPGCQADVMVVLIGDQGIGKSKGIAELVPDPSWYTDDLGGDLHDRKAGEGLQGKWVIEFGEFARINRATLDVVKSFISRRVDHYRPAYGRVAKDFPRQCIFVGTTNNPLPLQDLENRRFMPVHCPKDVTDIAAQREQLWAEAVHRYKAGEPWWISEKALLKTVKEQQEEARQHDEWEDLLREELKLLSHITLAEAAGRLGLTKDRLDKGTQIRLGLVMKAIGFSRKRETTGTRPYYWERDVPT